MDNVDRELSRIAKVANRDFAITGWNDVLWNREFAIFKQLDPLVALSKRCESSASQGDTMLHKLLATHAPMSAIEQFLEFLHARDHHSKSAQHYATNQKQSSCIRQRLCYQQNEQGATPLHVAIFRNAWHLSSVVERLLGFGTSDDQANCSLASIPMKCGSYPLHVLCGHSMTIQEDALNLLVEADPTVILKEDKNGDNPISLLWKNVTRFRWAVDVESGKRNIDYIDEGGNSWMTVIAPSQYLTYNLTMIRALRSIRGHAKSVPLSAPVSLHELASIPRCPPLLIRLATMPKYKKMFDIVGDAHSLDEMGLLPVHYAVQIPTATERFVPPHVPGGVKSVAEILLGQYPESVFVQDHSGRLPLHHALERGQVKETALRTMIGLFPESLQRQDPLSGLYPFMHVAAKTSGDGEESTVPKSRDASSMAIEGGCCWNLLDVADWKQNNIEMSFLMLQTYPDVIRYRDFCSESIFLCSR